MKTILIKLIRLYQKGISPYKIPCCRFTPTCSQYAIDAIRIHGVFKGLGLAFWRILRCNPFCRGGYDPVPEKRSKN
ncbi:MAG: membrane protein insertion efficiency factor YidD [Clostridia bacterium]|nr:membrane protein insertion efficiency factor YidD [Clostridia bacterium]